MHPDHGNGRLARCEAENMLVLASAVRPQHAVLRYVSNSQRPCIIGRDDFFVRYGEKEKEAVSSFDFLDEFSTSSLTSSVEEEVADAAISSHEGGDDEQQGRNYARSMVANYDVWDDNIYNYYYNYYIDFVY